MKAGAGAFFVASSERLFGADAPSSRVRFAIAGCREGGRGQTVLDNALKVPGVDIVCVCDVDSRAMDFAAEAVRGRTGRAPRKERDFRKVLEMGDVDGVISVTPDVAEPRIPGMKDILAAGKKPMDVAGADSAPAAALTTVECLAPEQVARKLEIVDAADDGAIEKLAAAVKAAL